MRNPSQRTQKGHYVGPTIPRAKRGFDVVVGSAMFILLLPLLVVLATAIALLEGRPILYVSRRRLDRGPAQPIYKFRTMRRDADRIANRDTVPVEKTRFLNLSISSPLYTPIGRFIERLMLTEMPQLVHVLQGRMSVVGNRPLPDNVVAALRDEFSCVEDRFLTLGGLTGPVQLIGRDFISDADRLAIEIAYCERVLHNYSPMLDFKILALTVFAGFTPSARLTAEQVLDLVRSYGVRPVRRRGVQRHGVPALPSGKIDPDAESQVVKDGSTNR